MKNSKKRLRNLLALMVCLAMMLCLGAAPAGATSIDHAASGAAGYTAPPDKGDDQPDVPPELPTSVGLHIGTLNQYSMGYARSYYDEELGGPVLVFKLTDAGTIEALLSYCRPCWTLAEDLARVKATKPGKMTTEEAQSLLNVQGILNDLLLNAGGGPDYHYVERAELIETAEKVLASEEYQCLVEAAKPLAVCEKTDARSLMLNFSEEELASLYKALHDSVYGEWSLRLEWLDEMEFSMLVPIKIGPKVVQNQDSIPTTEVDQ